MSNSISLCGDVLILILSLLPPKQFFQCKRICKEWEKAIEKHRQECEISIECVQRALHFLTWRDVVHSQKVIRQMEKNGNFHYTTTPFQRKLFIGQQFYFDKEEKYRVSKDSKLIIERNSFYTSKIIPIGNGFITILGQSPAEIYYTRIDRVNETRCSWFLFRINPFINFNGVAKKDNIIVFCITSIKPLFCWFDESKISSSEEKIDCVVEEFSEYESKNSIIINTCFGSFDNEICLVHYGNIATYTFDEKKIVKQSKISVPFFHQDKNESMHCFIFFEKEKLYALSCSMEKTTACMSPCYRNKALLSLKSNTKIAAAHRHMNISHAFVINDVLCIRLNSRETNCFDFTEIKKSMESKDFNYPLLKGIKLPHDLHDWNHSFGILKEQSVPFQKRKIQNPLFYLIHLDSFVFSKLKDLVLIPIHQPESFDTQFNSEKYESSYLETKECHFCLDGIYYSAMLSRTMIDDTDKKKESTSTEHRVVSMLLFP